MKKEAHVRGVNVFYGHVATGILFLIGGLWGTTQWVAYALGYQEQLGEPYVVLFSYPVYFPWQWFFWDYHYGAYAPSIFQKAFVLTYVSVFLMFGVMIVLAIRRAKKKQNNGAYGTARWAGKEELNNAGLLGDEGVILAQTGDAKFHSEIENKHGKHEVKWVMDKPGWDILRHSGPEHVFCFAPTRSGKGVGLVIPTLLTWTGSCIVYDIKKENWTATAGWRKQFSHCLCFDPTAHDSVRFNPLMEIRKDHEVRDVQNIADILVDPDGSKEKRDHWEKTGHALLVGVVLHVLYAEEDKTLYGVANFLSDPARSIYETLNYMLNYPHLGDRAHPTVAKCAREMLNKSENELSSVVSTANSFLSLYQDPIIARNTAVSDFSISSLMNSNSPVSLYLVVPPSDIERTKPLMRLVLNQMGRRLTEKMDFSKPHYKHRLLMMLDEFPSLGRLGFFETELAYMAGYGIKCFMIAQSLNQIEKAYGQNNSILDNSHVRVTYGALDERTAKRISDMLGQATEIRQQVNHAGSRLAPWLGHIMVSSQENARALLTPGEVLQLPGDEALVLVGGIPPYRAKKLMYYQDKRFDGRAWRPAPESGKERMTQIQGLHKEAAPWVGMGGRREDIESVFDASAESVFGDDGKNVVPSEETNPNPVHDPDEVVQDKELDIERTIEPDDDDIKKKLSQEKLVSAEDNEQEKSRQTQRDKNKERLREAGIRDLSTTEKGGNLPL